MRHLALASALACCAAPAFAADPPKADGPRFLVPSPRTGKSDLFLVDPASGSSVNVTKTDPAEELYPAFSPDGKKIAFACKLPDNSFEIWTSDADGANRKQVTTPPDGGGQTVCLCPTWSADGKKIAFTRILPGDKCEVRTVDADGSADETTLAEDAACPCFSPDGTRIAFAKIAADGKAAKLAVMNADGTGVKVLIENVGVKTFCFPAFSPDGRWVACPAETPGGVQLFLAAADGSGKRQLTHIPGLNVYPVWVASDRLIFTHFPNPAQPVGGYGTIKTDGTRLDTHPLTKTEQPHLLIRPAVYVPRPEGKPNAVRTVAFEEPAAGKAGLAIVPVAAVPPPPGTPGAPHAVWSADGRQLALGCDTGAVVVAEFDGKGTKPTAVLTGHAGPVAGVAFSADGKHVFSAGLDKSFRTWDAALKGSKGIETDSADMIGCLAISADRKRLATGGKDGLLKVRDAETGKPKAEAAACDPKKAEVASACFGPDGSAVFAGGGNWGVPVMGGFVAAFDPATGKELWRSKGMMGGVWGLAVSPDGSKLAGACLDCCVRVWDAKTGKELDCWKGHADRATGLAWSPDGKWVVSCGFDHTIRVWEVATGRLADTISAHACPAVRPSFSPDGRYLATTGVSGVVYVWKVGE